MYQTNRSSRDARQVSHWHNSNAAGLHVAEEGYLRINLHGKTRELQEWSGLVEEAIRLMVQKSQPEVYLLGLIESKYVMWC